MVIGILRSLALIEDLDLNECIEGFSSFMEREVLLKNHKLKDLSTIWSLVGKEMPLMCGPSPMKKESVDEILESMKASFSGRKRWGFFQFAMPDREWPLGHMHYAGLAESDVLHLVLATPRVSSLDREDAITDLQWKIVKKLNAQINCEGWLFYSEWLNDDLKRAERLFLVDSPEEFQAEAALKDFDHEIKSSLLQKYKKMCRELELQRLNPPKGEALARQSDFEIEKELVRIRFDIIDNLSRQRAALINVEHSIKKIEPGHLALTPFRQAAGLLHRLLDNSSSWVQTMIYIGLLNHFLAVGVYLGCSEGSDRIRLALAVQLSVKDMLAKFPVEDILSFADSYPMPSRSFENNFKKNVFDYLSSLRQKMGVPVDQREWMLEKERALSFLEGKEQKLL